MASSRSVGARRFGVIAGPQWAFGARERLKGIEQALGKQGLEPVKIVYCDPTIDGGTTAAASLLAQAEGIDALICYNDLAAVGALMACRNLGIDVPRDLALLGFDDIDLARLVTPAITSLGVPRYEIGRCAMTLLLDVINRRTAEDRIVLQPKLMVRASTLKPAP